jgi:hypothetical protein
LASNLIDPDPDIVGGEHQGETQGRHFLTYQDQEGDWLMAGDVPWEYVWFILNFSFIVSLVSPF